MPIVVFTFLETGAAKPHTQSCTKTIRAIGAKPNLYCESIELVCGGSPIVGCGLVERKAQDRVKLEG